MYSITMYLITMYLALPDIHSATSQCFVILGKSLNLSELQLLHVNGDSNDIYPPTSVIWVPFL